MKKIFAIVSAMLFTTSLFAQEKIDRERVVKGKVITTKGDTLDGYIREMGLPTLQQMRSASSSTVATMDAEFGSKVKFISEKDFDAKKHIHENDYTKCKPEDFNGYIYDYTRRNLKFTSLPVKDGKKTKKSFVQISSQIGDGEYLVYYYKPYGTKVAGGGLDTPTDAELEQYTHPHEAVYFKAKNLVVLVKDIDPVEFYETRCPEIYDKWNLGTYMDLNRSSNSKLNKFDDKVDQIFSFGKKKVDTVQNEARLKAFNDFIYKCSK
jgi:hypothetical protein